MKGLWGPLERKVGDDGTVGISLPQELQEQYDMYHPNILDQNQEYQPIKGGAQPFKSIALSHPSSLSPPSHSFQEIVGFLERQYDDILAEESLIKRNPRFRDNRVHALLYFITPTGHSLREMDIELMRRLSPRVNVIPVLGKADSMTFGERQAFKKRVSSFQGMGKEEMRGRRRKKGSSW